MERWAYMAWWWARLPLQFILLIIIGVWMVLWWPWYLGADWDPKVNGYNSFGIFFVGFLVPSAGGLLEGVVLGKIMGLSFDHAMVFTVVMMLVFSALCLVRAFRPFQLAGEYADECIARKSAEQAGEMTITDDET